jgi:thiol-disulfide isomerase/thioredoxin
MRIHILAMTLLLGTLTCQAQEKGFIINGNINMPDSTNVGLVCHTDTSYSSDLGETYLINGHFQLRGHLNHPQPGTLMTNNLKLVEKNHWPNDSIKWTYTDVFVSNDVITVSPDLKVTGGEIQRDFNELQSVGGEMGDSIWEFIETHPQSVISLYLANNLLKRGYNLTEDQVSHLEHTLKDISSTDSIRMKEYLQRLAYAKKTTKGAALVDLELKDMKGEICHLTDIVPKNRFVLVDFWASWCGICIAAMPEVKKIAEQYKTGFTVVGISIDTKESAWRNAMAKHPEPWKQYITTPSGYKDLFDKYQVGNGVPYYLMITPEGKVLCSPGRPNDIKDILKHYYN